MRELINNTTDWSLSDKAELLIVAKQILDYMGASSNKKAKDLLKTLQWKVSLGNASGESCPINKRGTKNELDYRLTNYLAK